MFSLIFLGGEGGSFSPLQMELCFEFNATLALQLANCRRNKSGFPGLFFWGGIFTPMFSFFLGGEIIQSDLRIFLGWLNHLVARTEATPPTEPTNPVGRMKWPQALTRCSSHDSWPTRFALPGLQPLSLEESQKLQDGNGRWRFFGEGFDGRFHGWFGPPFFFGGV